jgi:hypothetical protein
MMPKLVARSPEIYNDLASGINTNMSLNEAVKLGWSALEVDRNEIDQVVISNEYVTLGKSSDGLDILKPVPDKIRLLRDEVFGDGAALGPVAEGDLLELVAEEGARVVVYNGSSMGGLAETTAAWLRERGFNVIEQSNTDYAINTQIYVYSGTPYALKWLAETMGVTSTSVYDSYDLNASQDLVVVLGDDWAANNPIQ